MASTLDSVEDESFIILGSSPGTSMDVKCNGAGLPITETPLKAADIEEAMKDLSLTANMAFKAHFKLGDCPSPASLMAASTIVSEDKTTEQLQKRFGEILDENVILKETLKQNNESMKEQFLLIASCQEDMLNTHKMHREKFEETRGLVEKLRIENKKLKMEMSRLSDSASNSQPNSVNAVDNLTKSQQLPDQSGDKSGEQSAPLSTIEFVTSPDDDVINKLTAQLELVEKQRRQVIVDNEKLSWQKESLESIVDATSKERDALKEKLRNAELESSRREEALVDEMRVLKFHFEQLHKKHEQCSSSVQETSTEELNRRDATIQQLERKVTALSGELQAAQMKIFEHESVKMELARQKAGNADIVKMYREQLQDLHNRLKEAQTTVFQPIRFSMSTDCDESSSEFASFVSNVKLYDRTLKHLADLLNAITHGTSDSLVESLGLVQSLQGLKLDRGSADEARASVGELKTMLERQHSAALNHIAQIRSTLGIFEGIFQDYKEILKKGLTKPEKPPQSSNVEALTSALLARGTEIEELKLELQGARAQLLASVSLTQDEAALLQAQLDVYKSDFEAERASREKMASQKEELATALRAEQKKTKELTEQLDEVRKLNPVVHKSAVTKKKAAVAATAAAAAASGAASGAATGNMVRKKVKPIATKESPTGKAVTTIDKAKQTTDKALRTIENGNSSVDSKEDSPPPTRYVCPVCDKEQRTLKLLQGHVEHCLL
ncbi:optineurin isoform X1 [Plutella xylostella]|uniref:optineurin isoform X1 n=2 Tax=Plutella xylostella TaxID=51655 RepID=UPI00203260CF|nr:optineurin isoform X1 [Plutella xylostella]